MDNDTFTRNMNQAKREILEILGVEGWKGYDAALEGYVPSIIPGVGDDTVRFLAHLEQGGVRDWAGYDHLREPLEQVRRYLQSEGATHVGRISVRELMAQNLVRVTHGEYVEERAKRLLWDEILAVFDHPELPLTLAHSTAWEWYQESVVLDRDGEALVDLLEGILPDPPSEELREDTERWDREFVEETSRAVMRWASEIDALRIPMGERDEEEEARRKFYGDETNCNLRTMAEAWFGGEHDAREIDRALMELGAAGFWRRTTNPALFEKATKVNPCTQTNIRREYLRLMNNKGLVRPAVELLLNKTSTA